MRCSSFIASSQLWWLRCASPSTAAPEAALGSARESRRSRSWAVPSGSPRSMVSAFPDPVPITAIIADHDASNSSRVLSAVCCRGQGRSFAWIRARHAGYPVSGAGRRSTFVLWQLGVWSAIHCPNSDSLKFVFPVCRVFRLTMRWSEQRTAVRSTFEMTSTLPLRATRALVRRRSSCSR